LIGPQLFSANRGLANILTGVVLYFAVGGETGVVLFASSVVLGVVLGVRFAGWAQRKHGMMEFIPKGENHTPDIDDFGTNADQN